MNGRIFPKPVVIVSECLEFAACRYDGQKIPDSFVRKLAKFVTYVPICPEERIGLGVPRDPINVVLLHGKRRLVQPATEKDVTDEMESFAAAFLDSAGLVDGFILKSRSPSCGIKDVKIRNPKDYSVLKKGPGVFGEAVLERFPHAAVEDEARLSNFKIREHFLTKLFTIATFRKAASHKSMKGLVEFHTQNKLLFMAYNQSVMRVMGRIVANHDRLATEDVYAQYEHRLGDMLAKSPRYTSNINVLQHAFGYFSKVLKAGEKRLFLELIDGYRAERLPLSAPVAVLRSWIAGHNEEYLAGQTFFEPYPAELVEITDSGKGRDS